MKVILYTTSDCMFSKQEKDYLASKSIAFEEKNVQANRGFLQEMLDISNNFAGTPVTKIEKDDGQSVVLKGFTKSEFDNVFASNVQQANSTMPARNASHSDAGGPVPPAPTDQPVQDQPVTDQPVSTPPPDPVVPDVPEPVIPETPPVSETPSNPDPLPPFPTTDTQIPAKDDSTTEMHSTIPARNASQSDAGGPIDPTSTNDSATPPPTPSDQPTTPPADPVGQNVPDPTPVPPVETPPSQEPTIPNQDQQLNAILDSLKTKAEETTPATPAA